MMCGKKLSVLFFLFAVCLIDVGFCVEDAQIQPIIDEMEHSASANGVPPNYDDILPLLKKYEGVLSDEQSMQIVIFLEGMQRPPISKSALSSLFKSKIGSIRSMHVEYDVEDNYTTKKRQRIVFTMDGGKFFFDTTFYEGEESGMSREIVAYNGEYVSSVRFFQDKSRMTEGGIVPFRDLMDIIPFEFPLYCSGLLDLELQKSAGRTPLYIPDLLGAAIEQSGILFQKKEVVEGVECVLLQRGFDKYYFDHQKDYSLVKIEECHVTTNADNESVVMPYKTFIMKDHIDCGNGIWIPQKIELISSNLGDRFDGKSLLTVSSVSINTPIEETKFTDIFPDDTLVSDMVHQLVYKWGDRPSIDALLKETAKSKRVWIFKYISMALGLAMIIFALVAKYLAYRKRKNNP